MKLFVGVRDKVMDVGGASVMVVKLDLNSSTWIRSQASTVEEELKYIQREIMDTLDYDICLSLLFNDLRNVAMVKSSCIRNDILPELKIPNTVFINKDIYKAIKNLISRKDIVEVHRGGLYPILIEGMESEIYIPVFEPIDSEGNSLRLIGSLYLASSKGKDFPISLFHERLCKSMASISKLYKIVYGTIKDAIKAINIISVFVEILEQKEKYLPNHSFNVANWCREIGMALGYSQDELTRLSCAGLLHDVGKCLIDGDILNKVEELTEEEYELIKEHSVISQRIAENILKDIPLLKDIPRIIKHHHERYDGTGYPLGLKGDEVPFDSYIIGIADSVDAMLTDRPYRKAMTLSSVIEDLYKNKGKKFHPKLVGIMVDKLTKAKNQLESNLIKEMEMSSLIINQNDCLNILEGTLIRSGAYYVFKPSDISYLENIKLADIRSVELAIKDLNHINYYHIKIEDILDNKFYISTIKLIPSANTFSLLWNLNGILYEPNTNKKIPIEISKVGGDSLSFYFSNEYEVRDEIFGRPLRVKILFEDFHVDITGSIVKSHNFGLYRYFELHYTIYQIQRGIAYIGSYLESS